MELIEKFLVRNLDSKPMVIAPLGDIQWNGDSKEIWVDGLKRYIDKMLKMDAWFIGMGDYTDFASPSNRASIGAAKTYDSAKVRLDSAALEAVHEVYDKFLRPTKGKWLGLHEGHHYWDLSTGGTSDTRLCELLDAPFLGKSAITCLRFGSHKKDFGKGDYYIWSSHGEGGSSESALLLRMKRQAQYWERVNLFLWGHATKKPITPIPRMVPDFRTSPPRLHHRDVYLVGTGGWLKGFVEHRKRGGRAAGTYVEERLLDPVSLGAPYVTITPFRYRKRTGNKNFTEWQPVTEVTV